MEGKRQVSWSLIRLGADRSRMNERKGTSVSSENLNEATVSAQYSESPSAIGDIHGRAGPHWVLCVNGRTRIR